ncbi:glycosyltransferase [Lentzea sp. NPDC003310]|uniref:glycosyltransferase n=1 Tax=Lentzea sp. NPDC003310 TaxID=3154447 RepID=UPI0033BF8FE5
MKIAMVSARTHDLVDLSEALRRQGHEVDVHSPSLPGAVPALGDLVAELEAAWLTAPPDVVHTHSWTCGLAGSLAARRLGLPVVHSSGGLGTAAAPADRSSDRLDVERALVREVAHLIARCPGEAADLVLVGAQRTRLSVVPPGVDTEVFVPDGPRARRPLPHRVVALGELVPHSGFREIVATLSTVDDTELVIVPDQADDAGAREARVLQAMARERGVAKRVVLAGKVSRSSLPALLRSADVALDLPWHDRSSSAVLAAMACGVPVIATPVGALHDAVVDGVTGRHVPPRSPGVLARALRSLLGNEVERFEYGVAGRDRATTRYSWERVAADTARVYEHVASAPVVSPAPSGARGRAAG